MITDMPQPRDEVWDTLTECFGEVRTPNERNRRNAAVKQLREAAATPEEIRIAYDYCQRSFAGFTEMAVCSHLSRALHENKRDPFGNVIELAFGNGHDRETG